MSGVAIVLAANFLRIVTRDFILHNTFVFVQAIEHAAHAQFLSLTFVWPAVIVFAWLPLFALGILTARLLTPLSWIVGRTQWFLKEGKEHPLKAIGYVAAVAVFLGTVTARAVFGGAV
jgi:hypothetical protein